MPVFGRTATAGLYMGFAILGLLNLTLYVTAPYPIAFYRWALTSFFTFLFAGLALYGERE
jgi:hypothetical protein